MKIVLILLLAALSSEAVADGAVFYGDVPANMRNQVNGRDAGTRIEIWVLRDFVNNFSGTEATVTRDKADCRDEIRQQLYLSWHTGRAGFGPEVRLEHLGNIHSAKVKLRTSARRVWKLACDMR